LYFEGQTSDEREKMRQILGGGRRMLEKVVMPQFLEPSIVVFDF
jgi:hypothetical protein